MIKQLRIIILFILLGTGTCLTAQNNTVTPLFAGKIGYHQYFGNDILLKDVVLNLLQCGETIRVIDKTQLVRVDVEHGRLMLKA